MSLRCTQCGEDNPDGSRFCNHCGRPVPTPAARTSDDVKTCPSCGASNPKYVSFCQNCTQSFPQTAPVAAPAAFPMPAPEPTPSAKNSQGLLIASVLFIGNGILDFISGARLLSVNGYVPEYGIDVTGLLEVCAALAFMFGAFSLMAAVMSLKRRSLTLALLGGAVGMIGMGPFLLGSLMGLIGLLLVVRERDQFRG